MSASRDSASAIAAAIEGVRNFRDFGGHATQDGRRVRRGLLYRSGGLSELTESDFDRLDALGIRLIVDLRSRPERERRPTRLPPGRQIEIRHLEVLGDARAGAAKIWEDLRDNPTPDSAHRATIGNYRGMPERFRTPLAPLFEALLEPGAPAIVHCHAGKDRTGFACAMILLALGVPETAVAEDYIASVRYLAERPETSTIMTEFALKRIGFTLDGPTVQVLETVAPEYLAAALDAVRDDYGGVDVYLAEIGGLTPAKRDRLRELYLE